MGFAVVGAAFILAFTMGAASAAASSGCQSKRGGRTLLLHVTVNGTAFSAFGPSTLGCSKLKRIVVKVAPHIGRRGEPSVVIGSYRCSFVLIVSGVCRVRGASSKTIVVRRITKGSEQVPSPTPMGPTPGPGTTGPGAGPGTPSKRLFYTRLDFCQQGSTHNVPANTPYTFTGHVYAIDGGPVEAGISVRFRYSDDPDTVVTTAAGGAFQDTHTSTGTGYKSVSAEVVDDTTHINAFETGQTGSAPGDYNCGYTVN